MNTNTQNPVRAKWYEDVGTPLAARMPFASRLCLAMALKYSVCVMPSSSDKANTQRSMYTATCDRHSKDVHFTT
jgi:hypothetical protein